MRLVAADVTCNVVCVSVYISITWMYCAKTAELIAMLFDGLTYLCPRSHVLDGGQVWTNPFAATRGNKSVMCRFAR